MTIFPGSNGYRAGRHANKRRLAAARLAIRMSEIRVNILRLSVKFRQSPGRAVPILGCVVPPCVLLRTVAARMKASDETWYRLPNPTRHGSKGSSAFHGQNWKEWGTSSQLRAILASFERIALQRSIRPGHCPKKKKKIAYPSVLVTTSRSLSSASPRLTWDQHWVLR